MSNVIDNSRLDKANVQKYHFKVLGSDLSKNDSSMYEPDPPQAQPQPEPTPQPAPKPIEPKTPPQQSKEEKQKEKEQSTFVEELLKKTDELSSNVIKMQMQMEQQASDFEKRLQEEKQRAKDDGYSDGHKNAMAEYEKELQTLQNKFISSISKIENLEKTFEKKLQDIEHNLSSVSIDIAKEVISLEIDRRSEEIALSLSKNLIAQIQDAAHIEIKVSMDDYEFVLSHFKDSKNIEIIADDAIARGGVIILSDLGNIDGDLDVRLQKVKELLMDNKD